MVSFYHGLLSLSACRRMPYPPGDSFRLAVRKVDRLCDSAFSTRVYSMMQQSIHGAFGKR